MAKKKLSRVQEQELANIMFAADVEIANKRNGDPIRLLIGKVSRAAEIAAIKRLRGRGLHVETNYENGQQLLVITAIN